MARRIAAALSALSCLAGVRVRAATATLGGGGGCPGGTLLAEGSCPATAGVSPKGYAREGVLLQRRAVQNSLAHSASSFTEYDCNGDGTPDCGVWDYRMAMCANRAYCGHRYVFPDGTLDQSCRCRRCNARSMKGTAFTDPLLQRTGAQQFNAMSWGTFQNWADQVDTCAPWLMPRDDAALQKLLAYARGKGYKVRVSGAGHSQPGLVTDGSDMQVLVLSLAEYTAPGEWEFGLRGMPDGSQRATVNAGWTQMHLFAKIRPLGYFVPAQTAGYFFALGGIVANSVHGGRYNAGFIHSYVTRMRVMTYNGTIRVIHEEEELRFWRNSFGLLGIILGVELQLERRPKLQMYTVKKKLARWSAEEFWRFIKRDSEADIPPDAAPEGGTEGTRASFSGEFFAEFINGGSSVTMQVYAQKANSSVDGRSNTVGVPSGIPSGVRANYASLLRERVKDDRHGRMSWGEAARRDGAPPIMVAGSDINDLLRQNKHLPLAKTMSNQAISNLPRLVRTLRRKVNDGFFLTRSPAVLASAYFVEPAKAFEAMDYLRRLQKESLRSREFVWNLPGEFRFVKVQDSAVLQPVPPGLWFNAQAIAFEDLAKDAQAWKRDYKRVEDYWVHKLGAKPHMGKLMGFEQLPNGQVELFSDRFACTVYSEAQKASFSQYRRQADPKGLFASGFGMKLLTRCEA